MIMKTIPKDVISFDITFRSYERELFKTVVYLQEQRSLS